MLGKKDPPLLPCPRTHWACHWECCITGTQVLLLLGAAGMQQVQDQDSCHTPGHSSMQDCLTSTTLLCGGSLLAENSSSALPPASVPGLFSESFGDHGAFSTTTFTLPRGQQVWSQELPGMDAAAAQCLAHQNSWLIPVPQTRSLGHPQQPYTHCNCW